MAVTRQPGGTLQLAKRWRWLLIGAVGLAFWILFLVLSAIFGLRKMSPTLLILGSFLVPVTIVVWNLDKLADATLTAERVIYAFMGGGLLGLVLAGPLNWSLVPPLESAGGGWAVLAVGFIEEVSKLAALVVFSIGLARFTTRNGIVLGSAVGFGFAAFETAGYANQGLLDAGLWGGLVQTAVLRALLAPVTHGLYTAIVGAVLFHAASQRGHLRITSGVVGAYLWVSLLHGIWNVMMSVSSPWRFGVLAAVVLASVATLLAMWRTWVPKGE